MKLLTLFLIFFSTLYAQEVGVPYVSAEPHGMARHYSQDHKYFVEGSYDTYYHLTGLVLYDAESYRLIRKIDNVPCSGSLTEFKSLDEVFINCSDKTTAYKFSLIDGSSAPVEPAKKLPKDLKSNSDYNSTSVKDKIKLTYYKHDVLSNKRKLYFTLDGKQNFTTWNLQPFSKKSTIQLPDAQRFMFSADEKKVIFLMDDAVYNKYPYLSIWDLAKNKEIATLPHEQLIMDMAVDKNSIYTITHNNILRRWDATTFKLINSVEHNETKIMKQAFSAPGLGKPTRSHAFHLFLSGDSQKLIVQFEESLVVFDAHTLQMIERIQQNDALLGYCFTDVNRTSLTFKSGMNLDFKTLKWTQKDAEPKIGTPLTGIKKLDHFFKMYRGITPNLNNKLLADGPKFFSTHSGDTIAELYIFDDGEWVIMTPEGYFDASPDGQKYMNVLTSPFETKVIDDATFQKFHKPIYLNDSAKDK